MRSTITIYVTFIHTDRLANLLHLTLDSDRGQHVVCSLGATRNGLYDWITGLPER